MTALEYLRAMAKTAGAWETLNTETMKCAAPEVHSNPQLLVGEYTSKVIPARVALVESARELSNYLLQMVGTTGAMGNVANLQQQSFPDVLGETHKAMLALPSTSPPARGHGGIPGELTGMVCNPVRQPGLPRRRRRVWCGLLLWQRDHLPTSNGPAVGRVRRNKVRWERN